MTDKSSSTWKSPSTAYRFVGVVFLVAGIGFIFTSNSALWISTFTLGIVFITLSYTLGRSRPEEAAAPDPERPSP